MISCLIPVQEIDALNVREDQKYGRRDLEENGTSAVITKAIKEQVGKLNVKIRTSVDKKTRRKPQD